MARIEPGSDDPDDLVARLAVEVLVIGTIVGAQLGLDPPEVLISKLFLTCYEKLYRFDRSRSLRAWVWSYAHRVGLEVRREQRPLGSELVAEPEDRTFHEELISTFSMDDPSVLEDELTEQVEQYLERQRLAWPRKREASWIEALRAARYQDLCETRSEVRKTTFTRLHRFESEGTGHPLDGHRSRGRSRDVGLRVRIDSECHRQADQPIPTGSAGRMERLVAVIREDTGFALN